MPDQQADVSSERRAFTLTGLAATPAGSAFDCCLNFANAPVPEGQYAFAGTGPWTSDYAVVTHSATNGTTIQFTKRGKYSVRMALQVGTAVTVQGGLSLDESPATLGSNPLRSVIGTPIKSFGQYAGAAAGDRATIVCDAVIEVTQAMINAGLGVVRMRSSDGSDATPAAAALTLTNCYVDVNWISDLPGN